MDGPDPVRIPLRVKVLLFTFFLGAFAVIGQITIIGKQVYDLTGRELDLGLLGLAEFLPAAILAPFTGSVADRLDRRKVLAVALVGEAVASILLFLYPRTDPTSITPIFAIVLFFGVARAFAAPAGRALPIDLSPPEVVARVVAIRTVGFQAGMIAGPVVFGFAFVADESLPYLLAAIALVAAFAEDRLGVGAVGLGWLRAAVGIGAGVVAVGLSIRPLRRHLGRRLLWMVAVFGLGTICLGLTSNFVVAFAAIVVLAGADAVSMFVRMTLVPLATPEDMRGRVLAVENVFIGASNELGAAESGLTAAFMGLVGAVVFGGVATLAVVAVWWRCFPALRDLDTFDDVIPAPAHPGGLVPRDP